MDVSVKLRGRTLISRLRVSLTIARHRGINIYTITKIKDLISRVLVTYRQRTTPFSTSS